ncbi:TetR family transcriptional regulator [Chitinimonas arctica]|uniref:TetR family transcriptional regulator n=1 Tax=Chitinimonas arctica TaxID=2594795 RepID=A0A516SL15_9NEIS|nr:TetR/AcrR family transcriptional regulator [Chitinimonas arctica]QDQ28857.1 TetR family transcriptional regulator [Chitinimonas arctica]
MHPIQRLTDRKREAILVAAMAEFRARGFEATSMDRIAASADVSKRTVYNHFPSKDTLFAEILLQLWQHSAAQIELAYRSDRALREQLLDLMWQKMRLLDDAHFLDLARVAITETLRSPALAQELVAKLREREEGIAAWIRAALQDGRLKPLDPAFAANQLQGLLKSFAFWPQLTMGQPRLDAQQQEAAVASAVDMFLAYYGKDAGEGRLQGVS